jgi:alpha-tubulin suppressor-like RCC1 family protein
MWTSFHIMRACHVGVRVRCVRVHAGAVYAFGDATNGKLGLGEGHTARIIHTPQIVAALLSEKIIKVHATSRSPSSGSNAQAVSPKHLTNQSSTAFTRLTRWALLAHTAWLYPIVEQSSPGVRRSPATHHIHHTPRTHARTHIQHTQRLCVCNQKPGYRGNGRLGDGKTTSFASTPAEVQTIGFDDSVKPFIVDLWCGRAVTLLLDTEGVLYSFGVSSRYCPETPDVSRVPCVVTLPIDCGNLISGSLGRESSEVLSGRPLAVQFPAGVKIKSAAMGYNHGLAITTQGPSPVELSAQLN